MTKKKKDLSHYLITLDLMPGLRMHAYLVCENDKKYPNCIEGVANMMLEKAEEMKINPWPGIFLSSKLSADGVTADPASIKVVRDILLAQFPEAQQHWKTMKNFHLTVWGMSSGTPEDKRLMELH
jgi:hypothetical protein